MLAMAAVVLAGCSSAAAVSPARDQSTNVAFTGCDQVACTGTIDGAAYEIVMPGQWNGTLLLYSHGYRPAQPFPPSFNPVVTTPLPVPGWDGSDTDKQLGNDLLAKGYALAGSAYASNGWAVEDGVKAGEGLYAFFAANVGTPKRVYVWGDSLGGLITETIAEQHPEWVSGAAPLCGVMAGAVPNLNLALDAEYGVQQLLVPDLQIDNFATYEEAVAAWQKAASTLIDKAKAMDTDAIAKILTIAAIVDAPPKTYTYDASDITSRVSGSIESLLTAMGYGTVGRFDVEQRYGGNVSGNDGIDYSGRVSDSEKALIDAVGGDGAADRNVAALNAGQRVTADAAASQALRERGGNPSGAVQVPTITMHTADDPLVVVQNQSFFRDRYNAQVAKGAVKGGLVQLFTMPPDTYSQDTGAPYGAGHCNFTTQSREAVIELLDGWVKNGVYPGTEAIAAAMGPDSGYNGIYFPTAWPEPTAEAEQ